MTDVDVKKKLKDMVALVIILIIQILNGGKGGIY
jgi:hypothetical protein